MSVTIIVVAILQRSAVQVANVSGRRNFVILSSRLAAKKKSGSENSGSGSSSGSSSSGGDVLAKVQDPPPTVFKKPKTDKGITMTPYLVLIREIYHESG